MRVRRYCWAAWLILLVSSSQVFAAAVPAYSPKVPNAVGGVTSNKTSGYGFAANDPRVQATINGIGTTAAVIATGAVGGAAASVGWPALVGGAILTGLIGGGISLAQDGVIKLFFNDDDTMSVTGLSTPVVPGNSYGGLAAGVDAAGWGPWETYISPSNYYASDVASLARMENELKFPGKGYEVQVGSISSDNQHWQYWIKDPKSGGIIVAGSVVRYKKASPGSCSPGQVWKEGGGCVGIPNYSPPMGDISGVSVPKAIEAIPESETSKQLSDEMLALAINALWRQTDPSAGGIPWSPSNPVTPADVAAYRSANPSAMPTVGDFLSPIAPPGSSTVPIGSPATGAVPSTPATPGQGEQVDLGPDPNIGPPSLEEPPSGGQILAPLLTLMPELRNFSVPGHDAQCPTVKFNAFDRDHVMTTHCDLFEQNRSLIAAAMVLVWTLTAMFIVLRA